MQSSDFPQLSDQNHVETSPRSQRYNCIAWAAGNDRRWWWPDQANIGFWPPLAPREETLAAFIEAFVQQGYTRCETGEFESSLEKIAIYGIPGQGKIYPTHMARQLEDGRWTSKLGSLEDITHDGLDALVGPEYGSPVCFLARPRSVRRPVG